MDKPDQMLEHPEALTPDNGIECGISAGIAELGNQQERLDAARLAMFFDTDGCITMRVTQRMRHRAANLTPTMVLGNTSKGLIEWAAEALRRLGISPYVQSINMPKYVPTRSRLIQYRITVLGIHRVPKLVDLVAPYLVAKRAQAELLQEFCLSRLSQRRKARYTDRELEIANLVRSLNSNKAGAWRPISSESIRQAQELKEMLTGKMCSDLTRNRESAAEMPVPNAVTGW